MIRRHLGRGLVAAVLTVVSLSPVSSWAQDLSRGEVISNGSYPLSPYYAAPGMYGMMVGTPSYGSVRTYSEFSSPYGAGYAYGYAPYVVLPGRYGVGLWRPGLSSSGSYYGASYNSYRTFAVEKNPVAPPPPVGYYAPAYGPGPVTGW